MTGQGFDSPLLHNWRSGGIGRHAGLKILWAVVPVWVRVPSSLQTFDDIATNKQRRVRCPNIGNLDAVVGGMSSSLIIKCFILNIKVFINKK